MTELKNDSEITKLLSAGTSDPSFWLDGEGVEENFRYPGCVQIAKCLLEDAQGLELGSLAWWKFRLYFLHQKVLEEKSVILFEKMKELIPRIREEIGDDMEMGALFEAEVSELYLYYYDVSTAKIHIERAMVACGIDVSLTGK